MKPQKPIRRVSKARAKQVSGYAKAKAKFLREHPTCFACGDWITPRRRELHHYFGRTGRLLSYEPGFRSVCSWCHCHIHIHLEEARIKGWISPRGMWNDFKRAQQHYEAATK